VGSRTLTVGGDGEPGRLDAFLAAAVPGVGRRLARRLAASGDVRVNGRRARKGTRLRAGDVVTLPDLPAAIAPEPELALPVVHEDAAVVAVEKPGGMPSHALDPRERGTAAAFLVARWPEMAAVGTPLAPGLVHRLDTGTSGLLLAARDVETWHRLRAAFRAREVAKRYLAVVAGVPSWDERRISQPLAHDARDRGRMVAAPPGTRAWPAESTLRVLARGTAAALVAVEIRTGVTHQVRAHLALAGHPVLNDVRYGGPETPGLALRRHALHAARLVLAHPAGGRPLALESPLPPELAALAPAGTAP
jgi:23S rRNA pseudouridine1911/1915/1917 synthase